MRSHILAVVLVLAMQGMLACGSNGPTTPSETVPKPLPISEVLATPQPGSTIVVDSQTVFNVSISGGDSLGSSMAVILIRDDGKPYMVGCSSWTGTGTANINVYTVMRSIELAPNGVYAWAKGHTVDAEVISVTGVVPGGGGCYFLSNPQDSTSVVFEKAKTRKVVLLGWKVQ